MQEDEEKEDFQSFFLEHQQVKELIQYLATAHNETDQKIDTIVSDFVKIVSSTVSGNNIVGKISRKSAVIGSSFRSNDRTSDGHNT